MPPDNSTERTAWILQRSALNALLCRLDPDPDKAATAYEDLRRRLCRFFQLHHLIEPERTADVCLDRLAKRMEDGVPVEKPVYYALGIARMLLREEYAALRKQEFVAGELLRANPTYSQPAQEPQHDEREMALDHCLSQIAAEQKTQLLLYYSATTREKIELRQQLAEESGISLNALRNRMLRLRKLLEECLAKQLNSDL